MLNKFFNKITGGYFSHLMICFYNFHKKNIIFPGFSDSGGTRTPNLQNRNLLFYPIELRSQQVSKVNNFCYIA